MKKDKRWFFGLALALAGTLLWTNLSWAQGQGGGRGACCVADPANPGVCKVPGQGAPSCPVNPGKSSRTPGQGGKAQGPQGQGAPGQNAPNPPANPPNATK